ncbi:hypothetical protein [Oricola sp.]|uniref:hypothetical protein n=1 Tax=Oricola sp. TaxID=1979950 RepID=UPI003BA885C0
MMEPVQAIASDLERFRVSLRAEKATQADIARCLDTIGRAYQREVRLDAKNVIDFLVDGIGIEVKLKGVKRNVLRQCRRYCAFEEIRGLILFTNLAMGLPADLHGKPVMVVSAGRAHL